VRVLITGVSGFAGGHLAQILLEQGDEVYGVARTPGNYLNEKVHFRTGDLLSPEATRCLLEEIKPEAIYHLAGQAFVPTAWADPWSTLENNIRSQLNILQAMIKEQLQARLLVVASNEVYGHVHKDHLPVKEDTPMRPDNPYGVSKVAQDILALQYHLSHSLDVLRARSFNHIGPRQSPFFVASSFAKQIAEIEARQSPPVIRVGNLEAQRDFTDVTDVARAYTLLVEHGQSGEAYNIGTGQPHSISYLLEVLLSYSSIEIAITQDPERMRPSDVPIIYADNSKLRQQTGWQPTCSFEDSLWRVLEYWRQIVKKA
jgi:GDP-4-dehydro-6-deoxy-D-mannose reductase